MILIDLKIFRYSDNVCIDNIMIFNWVYILDRYVRDYF